MRRAVSTRISKQESDTGQSREPIAFVNGELVPASQAVVSIFDRGFRWGDAVYDVERTYGGAIFRLRHHLERLYRSLKYTRIDPGMAMQEMEEAVVKVLEANLSLLGPNEDYTITQVVQQGSTVAKGTGGSGQRGYLL